jgi:D-alanyl-D-alanine carboxypeptidase (penicillin-binding protein 5/6)
MKFIVRILPLLLLSLSAAAAVPEPPQLEAKSYVLFDYQSGQVLAESDAHARVEPASITKIMTAYVAFDELRAGHVKPDDQVLISEKAWRTPGSRTFVEVGKHVAFEDLLHGSIIQSGNDATVAIAEHIAGDESVFAQLMNEHAVKLGMKDTHYVNSTGLPDPEHYTTAYDVALLSQALIRDFPEGYKLFSQREFTFGHRSEITQHNRNLLLDMDSSADGIKTGHTDSAGYCLAASAIRDGRRLITAIMGTAGTRQRAQASKTLLDYGFRFFDTVALFGHDKPVNTIRVWKGETESLPVGVAEPLMLSVPRGSADQLTVTPVLEGIIVAPVTIGQTVGKVSVSLNGDALRTVPLVALQAVAEGSLMQRLIDSVRLWIDS